MTSAEPSHERTRGIPWRSEPFRVFFPLGVLLAWIGIGHWLLYALGVTESYSCQLHGIVQMQAFMMAFAIGFLATAVPRRTQSPPPTAAEMLVFATALLATTGAALAGSWAWAQIAYVLLFLALLRFASKRFLGQRAGRRPPAAFVLIPFGVLHGLGGALLIAASSAFDGAWAPGLGKLMVQQGVFLCFAIGVGSLVLPLMSGAPPPSDLNSSERERWKAIAYAAIGTAVFASLLLEQIGWERGGPLLRAALVASGLGFAGGAWRAPGKAGLHRRLVWVSVWLMPLGLAASGIWPDYRIPALHILFIGGFSLMAFGVATHVTFSHVGRQEDALGRPPALIAFATAFLLALLARVAADGSNSYFDHLGWAAAAWLLGSAIWLGFLGPRLLTHRSEP